MRTEARAYAQPRTVIRTSSYAPCPACKAPNDRSDALINAANRQGLEVLYLRCSCCGQEWKRIEPFVVRG